MNVKLVSAAASFVAAFALCLILAHSNTPVLAADNSPAKSARTAGWDPTAAERYLNQREIWWESWDHAKRDHGTFCISCHTQVPFALAQPILRRTLSTPDPTPAERALLDNVETRVRLWKEVQPFYANGKEVESRNAEAVLNAIVLSSYDQRLTHLRPLTRDAFANAWALQSTSGPTTGAWVWQNFSYAPWESPESEYHGAALMAVAVAKAPGDYRKDPAVAANLAALRTYLQSHYDTQPLLNQLVALWASASFPSLLTPAQHDKLVADLCALQRPDGGWSLTDLGTWSRKDGTPLETRPDGYATAISVLILKEAAPGAITREPIGRGILWLKANQDKTTGAWQAWSVNKNRDPQTDIGKFMSDAATAYAVLALESHP